MNKYLILGILLFSLFGAEPALSAPTACTMEYNPVCGSKQVQCIRAPCYPVYQTYGNQCVLSAEGATFVHAGECTEKELTWGGAQEPYVPPAGCTAWFDGCNNCSKGEGDAGAMCTLRACTNEPAEGYCTSYDTQTPPPDDSGGGWWNRFFSTYRGRRSYHH